MTQVSKAFGRRFVGIVPLDSTASKSGGGAPHDAIGTIESVHGDHGHSLGPALLGASKYHQHQPADERKYHTA